MALKLVELIVHLNKLVQKLHLHELRYRVAHLDAEDCLLTSM